MCHHLSCAKHNILSILCLHSTDQIADQYRETLLRGVDQQDEGSRRDVGTERGIQILQKSLVPSRLTTNPGQKKAMPR